MINAIIASSNTSSNIGNAFFYEGIKHVIKKLIPDIQVYDSQFLPYNAYHLSSGYRNNLFDYFAEVEGVDWVIVAGPVLDKDFEMTFGYALSRARMANKRILILSAGGRSYDKYEIAHCRSVLSKIKPDIFISRDRDAFNAYADLARDAYDGICFAFFAPEYFVGYKTPKLDKYIVSAFDFGPEPDYSHITAGMLDSGEDIQLSSGAGYKTKARVKNLMFLFQRKLPSQINGIKIIRPCHRPHRSKHLIFFKNNVVSSFVVQPYLNLYRNSALTVTDRLHAAVITMAFGNPARLVLDSNRTRLLDRAGLSDSMKRVKYADLASLELEREQMKQWLSDQLMKYL